MARPITSEDVAEDVRKAHEAELKAQEIASHKRQGALSMHDVVDDSIGLSDRLALHRAWLARDMRQQHSRCARSTRPRESCTPICAS